MRTSIKSSWFFAGVSSVLLGSRGMHNSWWNFLGSPFLVTKPCRRTAGGRFGFTTTGNLIATVQCRFDLRLNRPGQLVQYSPACVPSNAGVGFTWLVLLISFLKSIAPSPNVSLGATSMPRCDSDGCHYNCQKFVCQVINL